MIAAAHAPTVSRQAAERAALERRALAAGVGAATSAADDARIAHRRTPVGATAP